jgi:hypothetical protein
MPADFRFRKKAVGQLTSQMGVYILADLDNVPAYVGQSPSEGIRKRVQRHLTSARSDVIANRQIDVWEIAYVWEYPVDERSELNTLEAALFHHYDPQSRLMGTIPPKPATPVTLPEPAKIVQVMSDAEIAEKRDLQLRLPRQAGHYAQIVGHFLSVKNSDEVARAMDAHFQRLSKYHSVMLGLSTPEEETS